VGPEGPGPRNGTRAAGASDSPVAKVVSSSPDAKVDEDGLGKLTVFAGVREFPVRVKCATLSWHTLRAALEGKRETVSTE